MRRFAPFLAGLLFGGGLALSGMTSPDKIIGFLDFAGVWDPTLLFVMAGALGVHAAGYRRVTRNPAPLFEPQFDVPTGGRVDLPLVAGSAVFGAGWGIGGFCPGPAVVALTSLDPKPLVFFLAMLAGMEIYRLVPRPQNPPEESCG